MRRTLLLSIFGLLLAAELHAQRSFRDSPAADDLYNLEHRLRNGDKKALILLCNYVDSNQIVTDHLGYHRMETTKAAIAIRLLKENTLFLNSEIDLEDTVARKQLKDKVLKFADKIHFDKSIGAFIITPLQKRTTAFEIKTLPKSEKNELAQIKDSILHEDWTAHTDFVKLMNAHNPRAMAVAAEVMLKNRDRYNDYDFHAERYTNAIALLTGTLIGVSNKEGEIIYHLESDDYGPGKLNYAIYWLGHFRNYQWNPATGLFENKVQHATSFSADYKWYLQMQDTSDEQALAAFVHLTESDVQVVKQLIKEFDHFDHNNGNSSLPTFYQRFLLQIPVLTQYCKAENIAFKGSPELQKSLALLREDHLPYSVRYAKENELINNLTPGDITAVEYWGLVYENNRGSTASTGRILDKFYSRNWQKIISDPKQLALYLKKATSFKELGIIGSCNAYLCKFTGAEEKTLDTLTTLEKQTADKDVAAAANQVLTNAYWQDILQKRKRANAWISEIHKDNKTTWPDNMTVEPVIENMQDTLSKIFHSGMGYDTIEKRILQITEVATYSQLGTALHYQSLLKKDERNEFWYENGLIDGEFGITADNIYTRQDLDTFLSNYHKMNEVKLYRYYLKKAGIDIWQKGGGLDYEKIYQILKYDLSVPFVGGGGLNRKTGIFAVVKMLETQFHTKLGLPDKNEHWHENTFSSYTDLRREKWLAYLKEHNLVHIPDNEPPSFFDYDVY